MRIHPFFALVLSLLAVGASVVQAQEVLDNDIVARMLRAGLSADVIVLKIERTAGRYDVSADALIALKNAGAPDAVLKAMLVKGETTSAAAPTPVVAGPVSVPPPRAAAPGNETCTTLRYYTTGNGGWAWLSFG